MKIVHVSTAKSWRGGEQQLAWLIEELNQLGIEQLVVCTQDGQMEEYCKQKEWSYVSTKKPHSLSLRFARCIARSAKKFDASIIHTHDSHAHSLSILATVLFGNKVPLIVSRRVDFPVKRSWFSKKKYNHPIVAKIICVSDTIKNITAPSISNKSVLATVHSGINVSRFKPTNKNKLRQEFEISEDELLIGNVAALAPHKDYFTFVNTVEILKEKGLKARYFIIGSGELEGELQKYILSKKLEQFIVMTGFRNDVPEILPNLDVFLFTSETEGLGTSVLDAFASGVPVVATKAGGVPELVEHETTGMLAPVKNADALAEMVLRVINNPELKNTLVVNAKEKLKNFSREATAEKTLEIYKQIATY